MADDMAVQFSFGHVEAWIVKAAALARADEDLTQGTLAHLKIIQDAYTEYRRNISILRGVIREMKGKLDAAANI